MVDRETGSDEARAREGSAGTAAGTQGAASESRERAQARFRELLGKAEAGDPQAMHLVGIAYARGKGVGQDDGRAVDWFKRAAARGHTKAQVSLGYCYATGKGVPRDLARAYILLREAADAGDREGFELAERVAQRMHVQQLRQCDEVIRRRRILRKVRQKEREVKATGTGEPALELDVPPD